MPMSNVDHSQREAEIGRQAIDPTISCVVEAPAGSGKTTLLIKRLLTLLARVERPENILAITFTNKAAEEMRNRLLSALTLAKTDRSVHSDLEREIKALAQAVLANDQKHGWNLLEHPARLAIRTIDGFCKSLVAQAPILARSARLDIVEDADDFYDRSALNVLEQLRRNEANSSHTASLLKFIENRIDKYRDLSKHMLGKREQWLHLFSNFADTNLRATLDQGLVILQQDALDTLKAMLPQDLVDEIVSILRRINPNLPPESQVAWPDALTFVAAQFTYWQAFVDAVLTGSGTAKKRPTSKDGFSPGSSELAAIKQCLEQLIALDERHQGELVTCMGFLREIPAGAYPEAEWVRLYPILSSLQMSADALAQLFTQRGQLDFAQIAAAANLALGSQEQPEELLLKWDMRIQHILVDEFQDTSFSQFQLLKHLVSGFEPQDGRTVFLVGDPMQSIYGFREAQVGLFLQVADTGLQQVKFAKLRLNCNRRSQRPLVEWFNHTFSAIMSKTNNAVRGQVRYVASEPVKPLSTQDAVRYHWCVSEDRDLETKVAAKLIDAHVNSAPDAHITVLGATRLSLRKLANELESLAIPFEGVELIALNERALIRDLMAITRVIVQPYDEVSILALLKAPWCGLTLSEIDEVLATATVDLSVLERLEQYVAQHPEAPIALRIKVVTDVLNAALAERGSLPLPQVVERAWRALSGVELMDTAEDIRDALDYFTALNRWTDAGLVSLEELERGVAKLYSKVNPPNPRVHIMTVHAAKGLEWDHVMLVGMGNKMQADKRQLLEWQSLSNEHGERQLLIAPMAPTKKDNKGKPKSVALALIDLNKQRRIAEQKRLWYVAVTRAKLKLWLIGSSAPKKDGKESVPIANSGLALLWPSLAQQFKLNLCTSVAELKLPETSTEIMHAPRPTQRRVIQPLTPLTPPLITKHLLPEPVRSRVSSFEFEWASGVARSVGIVVHEVFERLGRGELRLTDLSNMDDAWIQMRLSEEGVSQSALSATVTRIQNILTRTAQDQWSQWIFAETHADSHFEWEWMAQFESGLEIIRIDRSFIDANGTRWIIDYKTSSHEGEGLEQFLVQEQERYAPQLSRYAQWLQQSDPSREIRLGLYFPILGQFREWLYEAAQSSHTAQ
jgi:ATP-dependent helicase/nuclease subunit A